MLTVVALRAPDASYYFLAPELSLPGDRWIGRGCEAAGAGRDGRPPSREVMKELLSGHDGQSGAVLPGVNPGRRINLGYDAVFSSPKSVSLAAAVGPAHLVDAIHHAHDTSVSVAFAYLEGEASAVRRWSGRRSSYQTSSGFAGAAFTHATSRALDPHLHTHVVFTNFGRGEDGRWSAFNSAHLWASIRTAGFLYQAHLRHRLTRTLGVGWQPVHRGMAEMSGIPSGALVEFSTRSRQIREHLEADGRDPEKTSRRQDWLAGVVTRMDKASSINPAELRDQWRRRSDPLGVTETSIADLLGRSKVAEVGDRTAWLVGARLARSPAIGRSERSLLREGVRTACEAIPPGSDAHRVVDIARSAVASSLVREARSRVVGRCREAEMSIGR